MFEKYEQGGFGTCPRFFASRPNFCLSEYPIFPEWKVSNFSVLTVTIFIPQNQEDMGASMVLILVPPSRTCLCRLSAAVPQIKSLQKYIPKIFGFRISDRSAKDGHLSQESNMMIQ